MPQCLCTYSHKYVFVHNKNYIKVTDEILNYIEVPGGKLNYIKD